MTHNHRAASSRISCLCTHPVHPSCPSTCALNLQRGETLNVKVALTQDQKKRRVVLKRVNMEKGDEIRWVHRGEREHQRDRASPKLLAVINAMCCFKRVSMERGDEIRWVQGRLTSRKEKAIGHPPQSWEAARGVEEGEHGEGQ